LSLTHVGKSFVFNTLFGAYCTALPRLNASQKIFITCKEVTK
jgi:hypothetical protein